MRIGSFEQWLESERREAQHRAELRNSELRDHGSCDCCGAEDVDLPLDNSCLPCTKYSFGYDEAEAGMVGAVIGGAVTAALDNMARPALIRQVVDEAIDAHAEACNEAVIRSMAKAMA